MSLRKSFLAYLLVLHLIFSAVLTLLLWQQRIWLLAVEVFLVTSFLAALRLYRGLFRPLELLISGAQFMRDGDFTTRLRELGQPEMDSLIGVYNQMIDHLRAERLKMQEQHFFLDKILRVTPSAMILLDYDSKISFANPAAEAFFGLSSQQMTGHRLTELESPFALEMDALPAGQSALLPLRGVRKVRCYKAAFMDQGHPRTFYLIEELTEELRKAEKSAYEKLIRMLSHEVNNSLGAANSLLHSCLHYREQLRPEDQKDFETALSVAISRTEHLAAFMKSFADIVKLPLPQREFTDLVALLRHLVSFLSTDLARRQIEVAWDIEGGAEPVLMDSRQMEQALMNVLKNSMEAIGSGGRITIRMGGTDRRRFLTIEDSGAGIAEEARPHLFTPFFSTKENGQGIGLTLVQEILARHKFEFSLDSAPGQPTRFTITFP